MPEYDKKTIEDLVEGRLPWPRLHAMMSSYKDPDRFLKYLEVLREKVPWSDRILLPLGPHLYVVEKEGGSRVTKCECGHEFGPYTQNWKLGASIFVRDTEKKLQEIYPPMMHCGPDWMVLREFYCPDCHSLLEVEAVPPGYPIVFDFEPDLETFYREWLGQEI